MTARERYLEAVAANKQIPTGGRPKPVQEKHVECAKAVLRKGKTIYEALIACGYPPRQARKGMVLVRHVYALKTAFQEETAKLEKERAEAPVLPNSWNAREQLILSRLEKNVKAGKDGGALSAKLLGSHKALNLWEPEYKQGIIILNAPTDENFGTKQLPELDE